ncbi:MAG: MerR family transcriptional regulator [Parvularculaceae bacterium]
MREKRLTIGRLSRHVGVNIETIRYYERAGLLPAPDRTEGGHRVYDKDAALRLNFIKRGRALGFSLDDIRSLPGLDEGAPTCGEVMSLTQKHLEHVLRNASRRTCSRFLFCRALYPKTGSHFSECALEGVRARIADLEKLEATLSRAFAECEGGDAPACPVIGALSGERG